jgi:hypothetical protein
MEPVDSPVPFPFIGGWNPAVMAVPDAANIFRQFKLPPSPPPPPPPPIQFRAAWTWEVLNWAAVGRMDEVVYFVRAGVSLPTQPAAIFPPRSQPPWRLYYTDWPQVPLEFRSVLVPIPFQPPPPPALTGIAYGWPWILYDRSWPFPAFLRRLPRLILPAPIPPAPQPYPCVLVPIFSMITGDIIGFSAITMDAATFRDICGN